MRLYRLKKRIFSVSVAFAVSLATLFGSVSSVYAAPGNNASNIQSSENKSEDNYKVAKALYGEYYNAVKKGDSRRIQTILGKLLQLSPTQRVHFFLLKNYEYYKAHFLDSNFKYFDVLKYIETYPEVAAKFSNLSGTSLYNAVLDDYLENGIFEGKSSCSDFDPVIAILAHPDEAALAMTSDGEESFKTLQATFASIEGTSSTKGYKISSDLIGEVLSGKTGALPSDYNNIFIVKETEPVATNSGSAEGTSGSSEESKSDDSSKHDSTPSPDPEPQPQPSPEPQPEPDPEPEPQPKAQAINARVSNITPYNAYTLGDGDQSVVNPGGLNGTFYNDIYDAVKYDDNKSYTVMIYMCGTDLEWQDGVYKNTLSDDVINMLMSTYDLNEVNVLLCVGGTKQYGSSWLNENSQNVACSIYYLNPPEDKSAIRSICTKPDDKSVIDSATDTSITSDTLKLLGKYDSIDMGDPSLLASFINLSSDLFPADNYALIMSDHGGGVTDGVCFSDSYGAVSGTSITVDELESALRSTNLFDNNEKLAFLGMDACLMGNLEIAYNMSPYANYYIASEEEELGSWSLTATLNCIDASVKSAKENNTVVDNASLVTEIAKSYYIDSTVLELYSNSAQERHRNDKSDIQSMYAYDLTADSEGNSKVAETVDIFNSVSEKINSLINYNESEDTDVNSKIQMETYAAMRRARARCYDSASKFVDLYDFMTNLSDALEVMSAKIESGSEYEDANSVINQCKSEITALLDQKGLLYEGIYYRYGSVCINEGDLSYAVAATTTQDTETGSTIWNELRGNNLSGMSIYMPFWGMTSDKTAEETAYEGQDIIKKYTELIKSYYDYSNSNANKDRINRLKAELKKDYVVSNEGESVESIKKYQGMFGAASLKVATQNYSETETVNGEVTTTQKNQSVKYINVPLNDEYKINYGGVDKTIDMSDASTDPYTDFLDVMSSMKVYVLKNQAIYDSEGNDTGDTVDIVIGQAEVPSSNISGGKESINIVLTDLSLKGYQISGKKTSDGEDLIQYAILDSLINQEEVLKAKFGVESANNWIVFSGKSYVRTTNGETISTTEYSGTYHVYKYSNGTDYEYAGTLSKNAETIEGQTSYSYSLINNIDGISFDQYKPLTDNLSATIDPVTENIGDTEFKITYSEEGGTTYISGPSICYIDISGEADKYEVEIGLSLKDTPSDADDETAYYVTIVEETSETRTSGGASGGEPSQPAASREIEKSQPGETPVIETKETQSEDAANKNSNDNKQDNSYLAEENGNESIVDEASGDGSEPAGSESETESSEPTENELVSDSSEPVESESGSENSEPEENESASESGESGESESGDSGCEAEDC